jgi:hypothetical protein
VDSTVIVVLLHPSPSAPSDLEAVAGAATAMVTPPENMIMVSCHIRGEFFDRLGVACT